MKQNWIIGVSGSDADTVRTYRVCGTKGKVKRHLVDLVRYDKSCDKDYWDYGTTSIKDVSEESDGTLYAYGCWSSYHNDYTATPEMEVKIL